MTRFPFYTKRLAYPFFMLAFTFPFFFCRTVFKKKKKEKEKNRLLTKSFSLKNNIEHFTS